MPAVDHPSTLSKAFDDALNDPPALASYNLRRESLLEHKHPGCGIHMSPDELLAERILEACLKHERKKIFKNLPGEAMPGPETLDMGGQFLINKTRIEELSLIFNVFAKLVPKGALQHLHFNTQLPVAALLRKARRKKNLYIRSELALIKKEDYEKTELVFNTLNLETVEAWPSIFSGYYKPEGTTWTGSENAFKGWMSWKQFRRSFNKRNPVLKETKCSHWEDASVEGLDPAERWVWSKMVLQKDEVYNAGQTVNGQVTQRTSVESNTLTRCQYLGQIQSSDAMF